MSETDTQPAPRETLIVAEIVEDDVDIDVATAVDADRVDFDTDDQDDPEDEDPDEDYDDEYEHAVFVIREVIERQLIACRALSTQLTDAVTDAGVTLVESPARVIDAVREGATLPSAFGLTGDTLADAAMEAGSRIRTAVGAFVNSQSALPDALITGTAEVAGSAVRAQGAVTSSAFDAAFTVASVASRGGDLRDTFDEEWDGLLASVASARDDIEDAISVAQQRIREALPLVVDAD